MSDRKEPDCNIVAMDSVDMPVVDTGCPRATLRSKWAAADMVATFGIFSFSVA
jgi:hypothetical protein